MPFSRTARPAARSALRDATPVPLWLDAPDRPAPAPPLEGSLEADLAVVGAGFTGLWAALLAAEAQPGREIVVLEAGRVGHAASGRNGGFCSASLTHGIGNGAERFSTELPRLLDLGRDNLHGIAADLARHDVECDFRMVGDLVVATDPHHVDELQALRRLAERHGQQVTWLDQDAVRAEIASPRYLSGLQTDGETALVDPARLAWGLASACRRLGVRILEGSQVTRIEPVRLHPAGQAGRRHRGRGAVRLTTAAGVVTARNVVLATNAFPPLLRRLRHYLVPVYDYVLATEPLPAAVLRSIGWRHRQGVSDAGNQFHYYRLTRDDRVVFGGYDAVYYPGNGFGTGFEQRQVTFELLAEHLLETFPQLEGTRITHRWGGAIDTCTRFSPFWGTAMGGQLAYVAGYTGLGVGASRFGARVALDLLSGEPSELTRLDMVRSKPLPFPPEPLRSVGIGLTRWSLGRADLRAGRRNVWLRTLDRAGLGFDS
ncbi:MAG TPA: FAD-binding oxidoreductase [Kineosporiaceae bacterium]